ncbi:hypothetical protein Taro_044992 [Colocasia esculenta]|uniref:Uncharacterized protein n=1 Tax=Colocasia esculenta TaxID=4460 RepID=A0A843X3J7_COLES|nr:hypothetical protein [Colocasia esculenta]
MPSPSPCCFLPKAPPPLQTLPLQLPPLPGGFTAFPCPRRPPGLRPNGRGRRIGGLRPTLRAMMLPAVDPWAPTMDSQSVASQLFAVSLLPYLGFLYFITKSNTAPKLTLFGFYFLLAFVGATSYSLQLLAPLIFPIDFSFKTGLGAESFPAGIYAKLQYGTSLSNVDWLHGGAESLLTLTNLFIVLGLRGALRKAEDAENSEDEVPVDIQKEK